VIWFVAEHPVSVRAAARPATASPVAARSRRVRRRGEVTMTPGGRRDCVVQPVGSGGGGASLAVDRAAGVLRSSLGRSGPSSA